jgi:hypothetical protein
MNRSVIYDFETLSLNTTKGVVLSMALLEYSTDRFMDNPYDYDELVDMSHMIKFDVQKQVREYKRVIDDGTLKWWMEQSKEAQAVLKPSSTDVCISELYDFIVKTIPNADTVNRFYTRGNTFDPMFLENIMRQTNKPDPFSWRRIRDTRSLIEGMAWGVSEFDNGFIPEGLLTKFVAHDPRHDIAMDVMRIQTLARALS